ncbi:MAG: histidine--tRNA ligase [Elusimicrobiales bacterium]|nr:histidine--tRNA ligase [Elusimicrobiales bacterium]
MKIQSIRGFRDILPPQSGIFASFEAKAREVFARYGYSEIRVPTVEMKELFVKSTGETTDIVEKEMYAFEDAGGRHLALRPEGTPGVVRAYIENNLHAQDPRRKFFYVGSMFRAERPQAGRYREFEQIGMEYFGNAHPAADAESIALLASVLSAAGLTDFRADINSLGCAQCRPVYRQNLIAFLNSRKDALCENCKKRIETNPMRALDCKTDGPELFRTAPAQEFCPGCAEHFAAVQSLLKETGTPFEVNRAVVRGLDYYSRTVFEFRSSAIGAQDAIAGGGRYDALVGSMGGPQVPAIGWALGADRVVSLLEKNAAPQSGPGVFVVSMEEATHRTAFRLLAQLRAAGVCADGGAFAQSMKAQLRAADRCGAKFAVIIGGDEMQKRAAALKNLQTGEQKEIPFDDLPSILKK